MRKDELLDLHARMVTIKRAFDRMGDVPADAFADYEALDVSPDDVGRSKADHKHAVFVLGGAFAAVMTDDEFSDVGRLRNRMDELAASASG